MANPSDNPSDLEYEAFGVLRLKRGRGKTGYKGVYPAKSVTHPFMAQIKNERTGKMQSIGSFPTAHQAAVAYTRAMLDGDGDEMDSPTRRKQKGERATRPRLHLCPVCPRPERMAGRDCRPAPQLSSECGWSNMLTPTPVATWRSGRCYPVPVPPAPLPARLALVHAIVTHAPDLRTLCSRRPLAGSVKAESETKTSSDAAEGDKNITPCTAFHASSVGPVVATPSCLAAEELLQRFACGKVGTVACILNQ